TILFVPFRQQGELIGTLIARRTEVRPFTPAQIKLLETFADQAVVAIENVRVFQELKESLEQQTATSEILGVIASSPTDIQPVLDSIAQSAARVCGSDDAAIRLREGDEMILAAHFGAIPPSGPGRRSLGWGSAGNEALLQRRTIHIPDLQTEAERVPDSVAWGSDQHIRSFLVTPLVREGAAIGVINIRRTEVKPFTDKQVALLETFASQAVIAIENVRLFNELQVRNRDLTESLEQQTATSEVLRVIASSPTELQPVLDTVIANAVTLAGAKQGHIRHYGDEFLGVVAHHNESAEQISKLKATPLRPGLESLSGRAFLERKAQHILDAQAETQDVHLFYGLQEHNRELGIRTLLVVPLLRKGVAIGTISIWRDFVERFTERQMELVKTFADQAVIAIENARLFKELEQRNRDLTEALEQQTATSEVLKVISRSTFDLQPVLEALVQNAATLCRAETGFILRFDGEVHRWAADSGVPTEFREFVQQHPIPRGRASLVGRVEMERRPVHVLDVLTDPDYQLRDHQKIGGFRTMLGVPMLREGTLVGVFFLSRRQVEAFAEKQIDLVTTFADQAVIAIENTRLLQELQTRNRDLSEALEQQTATSEVLNAIARAPVELERVYQAILANTTRLCEANIAAFFLYDGEVLSAAASYGTTQDFAEHLENSRPSPSRETTTRLAALERKTVHVADLLSDP